jgi:hypothetical protein
VSRPGELWAAPDFMMLGVTKPDGHKRLYASKVVRHGKFEAGMDPQSNDATLSLSATITNLAVIDRPSYGECLEHLMRMWGSEMSERQRAIETSPFAAQFRAEIEPPQREIEP